jgi:hypothetical protein
MAGQVSYASFFSNQQRSVLMEHPLAVGHRQVARLGTPPSRVSRSWQLSQQHCFRYPETAHAEVCHLLFSSVKLLRDGFRWLALTRISRILCSDSGSNTSSSRYRSTIGSSLRPIAQKRSFRLLM